MERRGPTLWLSNRRLPLFAYALRCRKEINPQDPRYSFYVTREAADKKTERRKVTRVSSSGDKNDIFILREVKGIPNEPRVLCADALNSNQNIEVLSSQEFTEIRGYKADLEYEGESKIFRDHER